MGWAWTYLVVAELVAANSGLGFISLKAMRGFQVDTIFLAIALIGILGLLTDLVFRASAPMAGAVGEVRRTWRSRRRPHGPRRFPRYGDGAQERSGARRRIARRPAQRIHGHRRPLGLRQVEPPLSRRRPHRGERGRDHRQWQDRRRSRTRPRHGVPGLYPVSLALGSPQRRIRPETPRHRPRRAPAGGGTLPGRDRAQGFRQPFPEPAFRRHDAARGDRPRACQRSR